MNWCIDQFPEKDKRWEGGKELLAGKETNKAIAATETTVTGSFTYRRMR